MQRRGFSIGPGVNASHLDKLMLARQVGQFLNAPGDEQNAALSKMPGEDREVVHKLARMLAEDLSVEVRQALAFELRRAGGLPKELAHTIARDVEDVAAPFLEETQVFDEPDWLALMDDLEDFALVAIARRPDLTSALCDKIVTVGGQRSVKTLVRNQTAPLSERAFSIVVDRFEASEELMALVAVRDSLPIDLVARLTQLVSDEVRQRLASAYNLEDEALDQPVRKANLNNLLKWLQTASRARIDAYVADLNSRAALTDKHLLDITRAGDLRLLESAVALKTSLPVSNVEKIIRSGLERGLERLFSKASFSDGTNSLLRAAVRSNLSKVEFDAD